MNVQAVSDLTIRGSPPEVTGAVQPAREATDRPAPTARHLSGQEPEGARAGRQPDPNEMRQAVEALNGFLRANESHIQFALHEKMKQLMVQVIDDRTQEVIKTFPPEELLDLAAKIRELVGALLDQKG